MTTVAAHVFGAEVVREPLERGRQVEGIKAERLDEILDVRSMAAPGVPGE